ncbi:MAG: type II toxin-antitoxin system Phd/YefM family antitoxin [Chloroflexi bacterium]|nr:type II toxin-antitoxin system Phd/YefM family antitoxin [Chloroflexota bacterium]
MTRTISKSKLKANMLQIFREIEKSGEELVVTDRNRPTLLIRPVEQKRSMDEVFAPWRGKAIVYEDLNAPTDEEWEALE